MISTAWSTRDMGQADRLVNGYFIPRSVVACPEDPFVELAPDDLDRRATPSLCKGYQQHEPLYPVYPVYSQSRLTLQQPLEVFFGWTGAICRKPRGARPQREIDQWSLRALLDKTELGRSSRIRRLMIG